MLTAVSFRDQLQRELESAGVLLDVASYQAVRSAISAAGVIELGRLERAAGASLLRRGLAALGRPYAAGDCRRVLGYGRALTGFAVAPLPLANDDRERVLRLGALCNFIVATYDHVVDSDPHHRQLLARRSVMNAGWQSSVGRLLRRLFREPAPVLMEQLVARYFADLTQLRHAPTRPALRAGIERVILRMYDAEDASLQGDATRRVLRRKAALPFVVMGLPAWLATAESPGQDYRWHLGWLYRLGDVFGWVDDAVDLEEDRWAGRPNRLVNHGETPAGIAKQAHRVLADWRARLGTEVEARRGEEHAFRGCLMSWLGGVG